MSIADRVTEAIHWMEQGNPVAALLQICCAIDSTAQREFGSGGGKSYEQFVHDNLGLITQAALGVRIENIHLPFDTNNRDLLKDKSPEGHYGLQHIIYHVVRCGLAHASELPGNIQFIPEPIFSNKDGVWKLPGALVYGFVIAVVSSPPNKDEVCSQEHVMNIAGMMIPIRRLWGKRSEVSWFLDAVADSEAIKQSLDECRLGPTGRGF